tara:strand:+ start:1074 stop:1658 length:585 start_codon:yes stop_codon:yes gene_type:complete
MKKIESYLPLFNGFYNTLFEYDKEECDIKYYNDEYGTDFDYDDFTWNYTERHERISEQICGIVQSLLSDEMLEMNINFQKLVSPKYYNFSNDSINCEYVISQKQYDLVLVYLKFNWINFEAWIKDRYTSSSGFISSHSNNAEVWINNMKSESHLEHNFGAVLEFILQNEGYEPCNVSDKIIDDYIEFEQIEETV